MKKSILIIFFTLVSASGFCTGQVPDYLVMQNDTLPIFSNPLEQYFTKIGKLELIDFQGCGSTACWRGYKAIWELKNDSLYLRAITSCHGHCPNTRDADLKAIFGSKNVFANWFNGEIVIPIGELVQYIHMGYNSIYEKKKYLSFQNGRLIKEKIKSNEKMVKEIMFREQERHIAKSAQDTIFYYVQDKIDWNSMYAESGLFCDDAYVLIFGRNGKIRAVIFESFGDGKWKDWWYNFTESKCRRKIKKVLTEFDLSYLGLPDKKVMIKLEVFYNSKTKELEHWR